MHRTTRVWAVLLASAFVLVATAPGALADMDKPSWSVGDFWEYDIAGQHFGLTGTGTMRWEVMGVDTVNVRGANHQAFRVNVTSNLQQGIATFNTGDVWFRTSDLALVKVAFTITWNFPFIGRTNVTTTIEFDPPSTLEWPITTGRTWSATSSVFIDVVGAPGGGQDVVTTTYTVEPAASVSVAAGAFDTTPVRAATVDGYARTYWSPRAGNHVRQQAFDNQNVKQSSEELRAYRYQGPNFLGLPIVAWLLILLVVAVVILVALVQRRRARGVMVPPQAPYGVPPQPPQQPPSG